MHTKSISGTVTTTVVLGEGNYGDKLTITQTGSIAPTQPGSVALYGPQGLGAVTILNDGDILGAAGAYGNPAGGTGGIGVDMAGGGALTNAGQILAGSGGYTYSNEKGSSGGTGGIGVDLLAGGKISTSGTIAGGYGGGAPGRNGNGGVGVMLTTGGQVKNSGVIYGAHGGENSHAEFSGNGSTAIEALAGCTITNSGTIAGGFGGSSYNDPGGQGGAGITLLSGGTIFNTGLITGGGGGNGYGAGFYYTTPGADGVDLASGGVLTNKGSIFGGFEGTGVQLSTGSTVTNSGDVFGGAGGFLENGGTGIDLARGGLLTNEKGGLISGGSSSGAERSYGGTGVVTLNSGNIANFGTIAGGGGSPGGYNYYGYTVAPTNGGLGAALQGGTLTNESHILGGVGGSSPVQYAVGAIGGVGLELNGSTVTNDSSITGGAGGRASGKSGVGGSGGAGVAIYGGSLFDSGTITGGAGGAGEKSSGAQGDAIFFGSAAATLMITTTAVFIGAIVADPTVYDTLILEAKGSGTLSGFGTTVTGFTTIDEDANARWTLSGSISGKGSIDIGGGATLTLDGTIRISSLAFASAGNETLRLENPADFTSTLSGFGSGDTVFLSGIEATSLKYSGHVLTLFDAGGTAVDTLTFDGKYTPADFGLDAVHGGTDLNFVDGAVAPRDVLPTLFIPPSGGVLTGIGGSHLALIADNAVLLHFGHS